MYDNGILSVFIVTQYLWHGTLILYNTFSMILSYCIILDKLTTFTIRVSYIPTLRSQIHHLLWTVMTIKLSDFYNANSSDLQMVVELAQRADKCNALSADLLQIRITQPNTIWYTHVANPPQIHSL